MQNANNSTIPEVTVYTDGGCKPNPGEGACCTLIKYQKQIKTISQYCSSTTNNKMELEAALYALENLKQPCNVEIYSDSRYVVNIWEKHWLLDWAKAGWKRKSGKLENVEELKRLLTAIRKHNSVKFIWVKGHSVNYFNNVCDSECNKAIEDKKGRIRTWTED